MSWNKKRKLDNNGINGRTLAVDTSKPTAIFKPTTGRPYTVSVALPGSIIANCQTHDSKTALAGQIARALAVFCIDEVIIFADGHVPRPSEPRSRPRNPSAPQNPADHASADQASGYTAFSDPSHFLHHILSYMETPPYLRRALFPFHPNLKTAGALPSLDMPHHLREDERSPYREAVSVETFAAPGGGQSTLLNAGFTDSATVPVEIPTGSRVTIKLPQDFMQTGEAVAVAPEEPREKEGLYWGFGTRLATSLSAVLTEAPYEEGYDFCVGTSERGTPVADLAAREEVPQWKHLLIVFGGLAGLEQALDSDSTLKAKGVRDPKDLFDAYVNIAVGQGSRTIRTEEALWIGLTGLQPFVNKNAP